MQNVIDPDLLSVSKRLFTALGVHGLLECFLGLLGLLSLTKVVGFEELHPEGLAVFVQDLSCSLGYLVNIPVVLLHFNDLLTALS